MKYWDAYIGTHNRVEIRSRGFFEKINGVSFTPWNDDDYVIVENYRLPKNEADHPEMLKFLKRVKARSAAAEKEV